MLMSCCSPTTLAALFLVLAPTAVLAAPVGLSNANSRYLEWQGKTKLLVTSTEHFGGLTRLNLYAEINSRDK